jgi:Ca2+-binding RTX toxin-like protein
MPTQIEYEYAMLAYDAYDASFPNRLVDLGGWIKDTALSSNSFTGFSASVYTKGTGEVVISFRGTDADKIGSELTDWGTGNTLAAVGLYSPQVWQAIRLVADTIDAHPNATLSFTGHSLGGGLASLMAVYFNKTAVVFDPAPFALSATSATLVGSYFTLYTASQVAHLRLPSADFAAYAASGTTLYAGRASKVSGYYVQDEAVAPLRNPLTAINLGGLQPIEIGTTTLNNGGPSHSPKTLHSVTLLLALMSSPTLKLASAQIPTLLELLLDEHVLARDKKDQNPDLLTRMVKDQLVNGVPTSGRALDKFAADVTKLVGTDGVAKTNAAVRDALLVVAMEYYRFKALAQATSVFTETGGAINFTYTDIGIGNSWRSQTRLRDAISALLTPAEQAQFGSELYGQTAWHIQSGANPMSWVESTPTNDAAIGGSGNDEMTSGTGSDVLIGGGGSDLLDGGSGIDVLIGGDGNDDLVGSSGSDQLWGGAGTDTYYFDAGSGSDVIFDADGLGRLMYGTEQITGALQAGTNHWITDPSASGEHFEFSLANGDRDLVIGRAGSSDTVTVRNWLPGQLGINLSSTPVNVPPPNPFTGDFGKMLAGDGITYLFDAHGNYLPDGAQPIAARPDDITGTALGDTINGGDGNDALSGLDGDDTINGGNNDDLIMGGFGRDTLNGGAGRLHLRFGVWVYQQADAH